MQEFRVKHHKIQEKVEVMREVLKWANEIKLQHERRAPAEEKTNAEGLNRPHIDDATNE